MIWSGSPCSFKMERAEGLGGCCVLRPHSFLRLYLLR